jgi:predicted amidophosphoribosyltransferase
LFDDVLTSGATAKACIHLLEEAGAKKVRLLVMAKTKKPEEKKEKSNK